MKSILLIGASSSVGSLVAKNFIDGGYKVTASYRSTPIVKNDMTTSIQLDLSSNESILNFIESIKSKKYNFDVCVFLAGILPGKNMKEYGIDEIDEVMDINFIGFAKLYKYLYKYLKDESQLIIVSSISAQRGSYDPIYSASKGSLISLMKSLSQIKPLKTRVNAIAPGLIENTSMYRDMDKSRQAFHRDASPTNKLTKKEDLAKIIFDITLPHWSNVNGEVIKINGGSYV